MRQLRANILAVGSAGAARRVGYQKNELASFGVRLCANAIAAA